MQHHRRPAYTVRDIGTIALHFPLGLLCGYLMITRPLIGAALFGLITWQSLVYAADMRQSGEVSVTLTMPIYPFIYGIAAGSALLVLVLLLDSLRSAIRTVKP